MNHYCTYFDRGFLAQGIALWRSLLRHDPGAVLWVLALDDESARTLVAFAEPGLRVMTLAAFETAEPDVARVRPSRSRVEYYFTLSPCWPHYLLRTQPEIDRLVYLDADLMFFSAPQPIWDELAKGSVLLCSHRFPAFLVHYERHGKFNVGVLGWRRDASGLACLDWWRARCLEWCYDRLEADRYADQKYLEQWPRLFSGVVESTYPGVNLAPWNWMNHRYAFPRDDVRVDGRPLVVFHFARFRRVGSRWWQSGQLDYGVMPWRLRQALYGRYVRALGAAEQEIRRHWPEWQPPARPLRSGRSVVRGMALRLTFGSDWLQLGGAFISGRLGLGRWSGRALAALRRLRDRTR